MPKILVAGELNPDMILQGCRLFPAPGKEVLAGDFTMALGSASAICAMGLVRLGNTVSFLSRIGTDLWGSFCLEILERGGLDISKVIRDPRLKTGVTVSISSSEDRALVTFLGAIAELDEQDIADAILKEFDHLHVSSYYLQQKLRPGCGHLFKRARRLGLTTSLDPGYDPSETWGPDLVETLEETDLFFPNELEVLAVTRTQTSEQSLRALSNGRTLTVVKLGPQGCLALDDGQLRHQPAFTVRPVDTTGAGDSFNAGFLHAWLRKLKLPECLRFAAACGALSTLKSGGTSGQPNACELEAFLARQ
jgi:sugar/nucleoside kinase (ribokinase family)